MEEKFLISVIVPVYNTESYLRKCVESILNQTYEKLQVILVDDRSTDDSGVICDEYAVRDNRVQVIHQKTNQGTVYALQEGLKMATGQYIGRVDSDDYIDKQMYEQLLNAILRTDSDFSITGRQPERGTLGSYKPPAHSYKEGLYELTEENRYSILHKQFFAPRIEGAIEDSVVTVTNNLFKEELLRDSYMRIPGHVRSDEDSLCMLLCLLNAKRFVMIGGTDYHYIMRQGSLMHEDSTKMLAKRRDSFLVMREILREYDCYDEFIEEVQEAFLSFEKSRIEKILRNDLSIQVWKFPQIEELFGKKIIIYGAGKVGNSYYTQISKYEQCDIVAWVDSNYENYHYDYYNVRGKDTIKTLQYDIVLIAVLSKKVSDDIKNELIRLGVEKEKLIWVDPKRVNVIKSLCE